MGGLTNRLVWTVLGVTFAFGLIGFYDDYLKLVVRNSEGLGAALEVFLAVGRRAWRPPRRCTTRRRSPPETTLFLPFFKTFAEPLSRLRHSSRSRTS